jgi:GTP-binding protein
MSETENPPQAPATPEIIGTVAIVGFPNVGKSTLINRLTETRQAVVHETPGVTRDRKELLADWNGKHFLLIDTGGVDDLATDPFSPKIAQQARAAIEEADLVLFVVDARHGITPGDEELAVTLRASKKPVIVLANKIDDPRRDLDAVEFHKLGLGDPFPLSALHGHGTGDLLDQIVEQLPGQGPRQVGEEAIRVAILGRPNVGKSSLLNALVGAERVIVSDVPGTTRDTIDTILERDGRTYQLVDTAGLRRKRKQRQGIDYYSELRALEAAERADIALVLIDASEGIVDQDLAVADVARKAGNSTLIVLAKWDRGRPAQDRDEATAAAAPDRRLLEDRPGARPAARVHRRPLREAHRPDPDSGAQQRARRAAAGASGAVVEGEAAEPPLRNPGIDAAAANPDPRQRSGPRHARLCVLGRERAAQTL